MEEKIIKKYVKRIEETTRVGFGIEERIEKELRSFMKEIKHSKDD